MPAARRHPGPINSAVCLLILLLLSGCAASNSDSQPSIQLISVPPANKGGGPELDIIKGRVNRSAGNQRIVIYARSGAWYVQPYADEPFTSVAPDLTWSNSTHLGTEYAALLVEPGYAPPTLTYELPSVGGRIVAIAVKEGRPPFWRTGWFTMFMVMVGVAALLTLYRWRLHHLSSQLNMRFEARLAERTRIAQDLHDTLLQGLVSASMQLHVANDHLAADSPAKPLVGRVMQLMVQVIEEGRDAVRGLRSTSGNSDALETAFSVIGQEFGSEQVRDYRIIVEGTPRRLHPLIRDEAYRIGREALANAFRHAQATKIEVELEYSTRHLRILVRDNGLGIDSNVLKTGREGHWGLAGMRERAENIGARFKVWSRAQAGTEVELFIPSQIAFVATAGKTSGRWFDKYRGNGKVLTSTERKEK
jgi:signal transduction histidine kinase